VVKFGLVTEKTGAFQ